MNKYFTPSVAYRFKKDHNLPIPVHFREDYFNYGLTTIGNYLHRDAVSQWNGLQQIIENYEGNPEIFLSQYAKIKDGIIEFIKGSRKYEEFNTSEIPQVKCDVPSTNIYNEANIGKRFLSIDLRQANFQTLRKYGVIDELSDWYEVVYAGAILAGCDAPDDVQLIHYMAESKYTRQVVFGQLNPKRTIAWEKVYIQEVRKVVERFIPNFKLVSVNSDELIYEIPDNEYVDLVHASHIYDTVYKETGLQVRVTRFQFKGVKLVTSNGYAVASGFLVKEWNSYGKFKCVPEPYINMFAEWYNVLQSYNTPFSEVESFSGFDNFSNYSQKIVHDGVICRVDEDLHIEVVS